MKVERILTETDLLPQRILASSRKKTEGVFHEEAVNFEPKEERKQEQQDMHYLAYSSKKQVVKQGTETDIEAKKEDLDVVV